MLPCAQSIVSFLADDVMSVDERSEPRVDDGGVAEVGHPDEMNMSETSEMRSTMMTKTTKTTVARNEGVTNGGNGTWYGKK